MALIVTSNIDNELDIPNQSNVFKPYSYQNRLLNTFKIPANSEIALQSAKINRTGDLIISNSNTIFGHFFGPALDKDAENIKDTTSVPFIGTAASEDDFGDGEKRSVNIDGFSSHIERGFARVAYHPSLVTGLNTASITCDPVYGGDSSWDGYKWIFTQNTSKTTKNSGFTFVDTSQDTTGKYTASGNTITSTGGAGFQVQARDYPISQNSGTCTMDFSAANASTAGQLHPWFVGLSRIVTSKADGSGGTFVLPDSYNPRRGENYGAAFRRCGGVAYCDIAVTRIGDSLRIFQSGVNSAGAGGGNAELVMNEVIYYGSHNPTGAPFDGASPYDIRLNSSGFDSVRFTLKNEELQIHMMNGSAATLICDFTGMNGSGATKNQLLNPTNCAKWAMYPIFGAKANGDAITLDSIDHYSTYPQYNASTYHEWDWWGRCEYEGVRSMRLGQARQLEARAWNDKNSATVLAPKGVNASGGMSGYENQIVTTRVSGSADGGGDSFLLKSFTQRCNVQETFGFKGYPITTNSSTTNTTVTIESVSVPSTSSNISLFVRLNNFTQNSINARMGTQSKIIAHLPRFDNAGNEIGGLYFEPSQRTYIDIGNTSDIYINSFDVDYVYENEQVCKALTGKTITCFHIRQKM